MVTGMIVGMAIMAVVAVGTYFLYKPNIQQPSVKASGLDDFNITRATEGSPYPVVFGRVKISGNILWYGNLKVKKQKSKSGGKGGGSKSTTTGYQYYLDCWQSICIGPARLLGVYKENKQFITSEINPTWSGIMEGVEQGAETTSLVLNKGDGNTNFTLPLEYFAPVSGVCTLLMRKVFCGSGTSFPTFHFVVESNHTYPWANPNNGVNPANAIWYILTTAGVKGTDIDTSSFGLAATYWNNKGYGINLVVGNQGKVREKIEQILTPLGGFYFEFGGRHYLNPSNPYEASYGSIEDEFIKFTLSRRSWEDTINDIKATFTDESKDFTERTAVVQNSASVNLLGKIYTKTYDLTMFRTLGATQKRLADLIKFESYPYAEVEFTTSLRYADLNEGMIVNLTNTQMGLGNASFRIVRKNYENIDSNEIIFNGVQVVESLFDDKWVDIGTGSSTWAREVQKPIPLTKTRIMEVPRTVLTDSPTILVLAARETEYENLFHLYYSATGEDYSLAKSFGEYSMYGTLKVAYTSSTYDIDDTVGIVFTPFKLEYDIPSLSRAGLFSENRFLVIDNEIMKFQTATLNDDGTITLTGVVRGVMNTTKAAHSANAGVWIVDDPECTYTPSSGVIAGYYKIAPANLMGAIPLSSVSAITVGPSSLALNPFSISRVNGSRSGAEVVFTVYVRDMTPAGAGVSPSTTFFLESDTDVVVEWKLSTGTVWNVLPVQVATFSVSNAAGFTVNVRAKEFGKYCATVNLAVGTTDGNYTV
ncbi:MAG: phage tail protein [Syntrophus sp. (in: bacteria)]|nr:phage tail protein [Syntrophus sp. (in: bacteria)]